MPEVYHRLYSSYQSMSIRTGLLCYLPSDMPWAKAEKLSQIRAPYLTALKLKTVELLTYF